MSGYRVGDFLEKLDLFQRPLPGFNVRGNESSPSCGGGCLSLLTIMILFTYSLGKFEMFLKR